MRAVAGGVLSASPLVSPSKAGHLAPVLAWAFSLASCWTSRGAKTWEVVLERFAAVLGVAPSADAVVNQIPNSRIVSDCIIRGLVETEQVLDAELMILCKVSV